MEAGSFFFSVQEPANLEGHRNVETEKGKSGEVVLSEKKNTPYIKQ